MGRLQKRQEHGRDDRIDRRLFLKRASVAVGATAALGYGSWRFMLHHLEVVPVTLPIANLPTSLEGARIVQLSDLHVGPDVDDAYVQRALTMAGTLKPDVLVFTGDFVTWRGPAQLAQLDRVFEAMPVASLARIAVLGNHDYGVAWREPDVAQAVGKVLHRHGVQVLHNEVQVIEGLSIVGIDDWWADQADVDKARASLAAEVPSLVLCHNPDVADHPVWKGYRGWMLSGHTHGGQCKPPFLSPPILPLVNKRYAAGAISLADGRTVYVNRGIGHLLPVRVNVRPEITSFQLARA